MMIFDALRQADARRRLDADARALVAYANRRWSAPTSYALDLLEAPADEEVLADDLPTTAFWAGPIGMETELTGDGRLISDGALRWEITDDNRPPMRYVRSDVGAHDGAEVAGSILSIERRPGGVIWGEGDFDMASEAGRAAFVTVRDKRQNGVSMDLDDVSFEIRVAGELFDEISEMWDSIEEEEPPPTPDEIEEPERDEEGRVTVAKINADDEVMVTTDARVRAATIVAVPAFAGARIGIVDSISEAPAAAEVEADAIADEALGAEVVDLSTDPVRNALASRDGDRFRERRGALVAAAPMHPPTSWFAKMSLDGPTPMTVTKDGRVYGHAALWGTCHVSHSAGGKCVTPPNSPSDYAWFHTGALETAEGDVLAVGHLTMNTGHAPDDLSPAATLSHYDNTGTVAADVRMYEDEWGIQYVGGMRPSITGEKLRAFRSAPISGDWRRVGNSLEMIAALAVNVPGFGVPRTSGFVHDDNLVSLVASGMVLTVEDEEVPRLSSGDLAYLHAIIDREKRSELSALAARRNRVKVAAFAARRKKG